MKNIYKQNLTSLNLANVKSVKFRIQCHVEIQKMERFGNQSLQSIDEKIRDNLPSNTRKTKKTIWNQFSTFCEKRKYVLDATTSNAMLAEILKDWAFNMKRGNGEDYKENVVKTMWNSTAKMIQEKYFSEFNREIDPFKHPIFKDAREAKNAKRRELQADPSKRTTSAAALEKKDVETMLNVWDEDTPEGLQRKLFTIISVELAWRGGEGLSALVHHFKEEILNDGTCSGRIEYNPIFTKTAQGGEKKCASSKWLVPNGENPANCPVRLIKKLLSKRGSNNKSDRLFLTANRYWNSENSIGWYKDVPVGKNTLSKWNKDTARRAGLNVEKKKITNHSSRATAVSTLAKSGVGEQQIIKITGHTNTNSIRPYLQLDQEHHEQILRRMRQDPPSHVTNAVPPATCTYTSSMDATSSTNSDFQNNGPKGYHNCTFNINCTNFYMN